MTRRTRAVKRGGRRLLITGAEAVITSADGPVYAPGEVAVEDGRIVAVGQAGSTAASWRPHEVIRADGAVVIPGLVNAHTHSPMVLLRGYAEDMAFHPWLAAVQAMEENFLPEDIYWGAQLAIAEQFRFGVTTFAEMYFGMAGVARAVAETGARAVLSRGLIGVARNADAMLAEGLAFCREWQGAAEGRITTMMGPHAPYTCPPKYLERVVAAAAELGVGLHIHLSESRREQEEHLVQYGETPTATVARAGIFTRPVLIAHFVYATPADLELVAEARAGIAHCPTSNLKLANGVAPVVRWLSAGVAVGLGTDGAASNNDLDLWEEMRLASLLAKGTTGDPVALPAAAAFHLATAGGAAAVGLGEVTGRLAPGFAADLVLVDWTGPHLCPTHRYLSNLVFAAHGTDVRLTMVAGRVVYDRGAFPTLEIERVKAEVVRRAERLARSATPAGSGRE
ncbi:MAG: amidohydrolase [Bacillota bacterium]|nr:amidohydrolase [Bacillota bacterium]